MRPVESGSTCPLVRTMNGYDSRALLAPSCVRSMVKIFPTLLYLRAYGPCIYIYPALLLTWTCAGVLARESFSFSRGIYWFDSSTAKQAGAACEQIKGKINNADI